MAADESRRVKRGPVYPRVQLGRLLSPVEMAGEIINFRVTVEGSLRSVRGPTPYLPNYSHTGSIPAVTGRKTIHDYGRMHGIFHGVIQRGQREVLLVHVRNELWVFEGWNRGWRALISPTEATALLSDALIDDSRARAPTQFVATPNGIVIIPQADLDPRPYFYDGEVILPLGYDQSPSAPSIIGPMSPPGHLNDRLSNTEGYSVRRHTMNRSRASSEFFHGKYATGRIGSITTIPDANRDVSLQRSYAIGCPYLLHGEWHGATQWIDYFGNLSPTSNNSQSVRLYGRPTGWDDDTPYPGETLQHQFVWTSVESGPKGTIGRMLYRTKDTLNSGSANLFEIPSTAFGRSAQRTVELVSSAQFATVPENCSHVFPDNVPDSALVSPAPNIVRIPKFKIAQMAMGRMFVANTQDDPGAVLYSSIGRWGTFERDSILFPDPSGQEVTGLLRIEGGILAFTQSSIYAILPSDDGLGFKSFPVSTTVGCAATDSIAQLSSGLVIWLAHDGFYAYDGSEVASISTGLENELKKIIRGRIVQATATIDPITEEYICWVPTEDAIYNNKGFVFDGSGWKLREGAKYVALTTTRDHRQYVLGCGIVNGDYPAGVDDQPGQAPEFQNFADADREDEEVGAWGVWVLDHESRNFYPNPAVRKPVFETAWIGAGEATRKTALTVRVWFRETSTTEQVRVRVYRDWRKDDQVDSLLIDLDSPEDPSPAWGVATTDDAVEWQKRRPYWIRKDIYVPSCEVFKLRFEGISQTESVKKGSKDTLTTTEREVPADIEIIGLIVDESPRPGSARVPRSG
jgi:hypothetical protein